MSKTSSGSIFGGMLLITGSCIGAGMLALPILSGLSGFFPSLIMFFCAWAFMTLTALLLIEVNGWFSTKVNLVTMVGKTLGTPGKIVCWVFYLFLFYALLVAYIAGSGSLLASILEQHFSLIIPSWGGSLLFVILFGLIVFRGTRPVDLWNRFLMVFKIAAFLGLVFLGASHVQTEYLMRSDPQYAIFALPVLVISFGFHNMIPTITNYMGGDLKKVRHSIILGGLFALVIYVVWQVIVLGIVPLEGENGILNSLKHGEEASQALSGILGSSWASYFTTLLAFFAILTSFLAQSLSLTHFLADGLKVSYKRHEEGALVMLSLIPPLLLAVYFPNIFFKALNFAGGICAVILFGILPVMMVWKGRYHQKLKAPWQVKGGRGLLVAIFLFSLFIAFFQLSNMFNAPYLPKL